MRSAFLWLSLFGFFSAVAAKSIYFPDVSNEEYKKFQEVARFVRKRLDEADAENLPLRDSSEGAVGGRPYARETEPPFEYSLPSVNPSSPPTAFAVAPSDPRYYQDFGTPYEPPVATPYAPTEVADPRPKRPRTEGSGGAWDNDRMAKEAHSSSSIQEVTVTSLDHVEESRSLFIGLFVIGCVVGFIAIIALTFGCYKLRKNAKAAADVDYPAYGVTGPNKEISPTSGDKRLAQSAQMYHYQHQKQQIIAMESMNNKDRRNSISDAESEEDNEEGDYTVYECPGLASTGEMEVKNPLFQDDQTPAPKAPAAEESAEEPEELPNLISFD